MAKSCKEWKQATSTPPKAKARGKEWATSTDAPPKPKGRLRRKRTVFAQNTNFPKVIRATKKRERGRRLPRMGLR